MHLLLQHARLVLLWMVLLLHCNAASTGGSLKEEAVHLPNSSSGRTAEQADAAPVTLSDADNPGNQNSFASLIASRPTRKLSVAARRFRSELQSRPEIQAIEFREDDHAYTIAQLEALRDATLVDDKVWNKNFHWAMKHLLEDRGASMELQRTYQSLSFRRNKRMSDERAREKNRLMHAAKKKKEKQELGDDSGGAEHFNTASNRTCRRAKKKLEKEAPHLNRPLLENLPGLYKEGKLLTPMQIVGWASSSLTSIYSSEKVLTAAIGKFFEDNATLYDPLAVNLAMGRRSLELKSKRTYHYRGKGRGGDGRKNPIERSMLSTQDAEAASQARIEAGASSRGRLVPHQYDHHDTDVGPNYSILESSAVSPRQRTNRKPDLAQLLHSVDWWRPAVSQG